MNVNM